MTPGDWPALLAAALAPGALTSHYQPIVDLRRGVVVGFEALARFTGLAVRDPELWFAAAREHGMAAALEAAALRSALQRRRVLPTNTFLTVNLGPEVVTSPEVQDVLARQATLAGLVVELTEQTRVESYAELEPALDELRSRGAMIAIDDAGSGYAGLQHLLGIRPAFIKLDRGLVSGVDTDEAKRALVEMMGTLSGRLDAWLLAEGVETAAELDTLARMRVPLAQGYHLGRPTPSWSSLAPEVGLRLLGLGRDHGSASLRSLLEWAPTCTDPGEAASGLEVDGVEVVVVLDGDGRPSMTFDEHGMLRSMRDGLRVNVDAAIADAAQRALTRPRGERFAPLVCTDNAGRYVGVVRMERVLDRLATAVREVGRTSGAA